MTNSIAGEEYQIKRVINHLLLTEDHFNSFLESQDELLCVDCLISKHLPTMQLLAIECLSGVCKTDTAIDLMREVNEWTGRVIKKNEFNKKEVEKLLQEARDFRKKLQPLLKDLQETHLK